MNLFDIVGPVMVGPSSSHTAGAVRIGQVSRHLLGESVKEAKILLHGSFLATGKGHGTDKALVAGLLGMAADDIRIPDSFDIAKESGVKFEIGKIQLKNAHPNSVKLLLVGESGRNLEIVACSLLCHLGRVNERFLTRQNRPKPRKIFKRLLNKLRYCAVSMTV